MPEGPRLLAVGISNGTTISVDVTTRAHVATKVALTASYTTLDPPGYVSRPSMTGTAAALLDYPKTIASGTTITVLALEAAAIVAAGGGTLV